ncbi:hypothetical protein GCM10009868_02480 [Terrabacter aerolatus]|uniref:Uncharacterized protein n=1 Tax=Terrabacter aerolatus TaxID=422442 RepID=A0A512D2D6_9MICO|nr:hypothetical protein [Terrabacter aerolatus]GEO30635.1 hypothetical protein TAE01_24450 [Terrabacter aerolatus]
MTAFWTVVGVLLAAGLGLIVWGSQSGSGPSGQDLSARRGTETRVGAVLVVVSLGALVIAYFTAHWP